MRIILLWIGLIYSYTAIAQYTDVSSSSSTFDKIKNSLESITQGYIDRSLLMNDFPKDKMEMENIYNIPNSDLDNSKYFHEYHLANLEYKKPTKGINLSGGYLQNVKGSILEEDGSFYLSKWQMGLDWDLLQDGHYKSKANFAKDKIQYQIDSIRILEDSGKQAYAATYDYIIYLFNGLKIQLVNRHKMLLAKELEVAYQLYYLKYIHWEEVLTLMSKKAEVEIAAMNYINYNTQVDLPFTIEATSLKKMPLVEIDFDKLNQLSMDTAVYQNLTRLELEKDELITKWEYKPHLKTYLRYSHYNNHSTSANQRDFLSGGLQLQIPIVSKKKQRQNRIEAKARWLNHKNEMYYENVQNEMLNHYYEYEYTHRQYIHFYHKKLLAINQIGRELSKRKLNDPGYSPIEITKHLDNLYSLDLELLDIQQKMYLKLLKIFQYVPADARMDLVQVTDIEQLFKAYHSTHKIKMASYSITNKSKEFVIAYLQKNNIDDIVIDQRDYQNYIEFFKDSELPINLSMSLALEPYMESSYEIPSLSFKPHSVYVEIIPNNLRNWEINKTEYQEKYLTLISSLSKSSTITTVAPIGNDPKWIKDLANINNQIVLKFVEQTDPDIIVEKIRAIGLSSEINVQIELDCSNFLDRFQMEEFVQIIKERTNIQFVVLNNFERLLELESNTIELYEKQRF